MKKQIIIGGFLAISTLTHAQWSTSGLNVYKTNPNGNVGIGTGTTPIFKLDILTNLASDDGIRIAQNGTGNTSLFLRNSAGPQWGLHNTGSGSSLGAGHFLIEAAGTSRFLIDGSTGYVGIGTTAPTRKLHVEELSSSATTGALIDYSSGTAAGGLGLRVQSANVGAVSTQLNTGIQVSANCGAVGTSVATGIRSDAGGAQQNYAGFFKTLGANGTDATAVYAEVSSSSNVGAANVALWGVSSFTGTNDWAGRFDGNVQINGTAVASSTPPPTLPGGPYALEVNGNALTTAAGWYASSDRRFKDNIKSLDNCMENLQKINGYSYTYKREAFPKKAFESGTRIGLIAQELREIYPELVSEGPDGYLAVNYQGLIPVLLEVAKEEHRNTTAMQKQIDAQQEQIAELLARTSGATGIQQAATPAAGFAMDQNEPNPFTNETVISYTLPAQVASAHMTVYDLSGKQVATFPIEQKGTASLTITSEKLAAGIYIYSIVADGKLVDSKRMIVSNK